MLVPTRPPNAAYGWCALQSTGWLVFGWVGGHDGAGLDPGGDDGDVGVGDFGAGGWGHGHGVVGGAFMADELDDEGLLGVAGNDDGAVVAAAKEAGFGVDVEAAAMVHAGVATVAVGGEDGLDALGVELDRVGRGSGLGGDGVWMPEGGAGEQSGGGDGERGDAGGVAGGGGQVAQ